MSYIVFQRIALQFFINIFYFPVWWYSKGLMRALRFCIHLLKIGNKNMVPMLWLRNIFVPMFGQYDWQGKIVSFLVRLANVIGRSIALFFWFLVVVIIFLIWVLLPVFVFVMFLNSLTV